MSENVNFYQRSKENYNPSEMQGELQFLKIILDGHLLDNNYIIWQQLMNNLFK